MKKIIMVAALLISSCSGGDKVSNEIRSLLASGAISGSNFKNKVAKKEDVDIFNVIFDQQVLKLKVESKTENPDGSITATGTISVPDQERLGFVLNSAMLISIKGESVKDKFSRTIASFDERAAKLKNRKKVTQSKTFNVTYKKKDGIDTVTKMKLKDVKKTKK